MSKQVSLYRQLWDLYYTTNSVTASQKINEVINRVRREKRKAKK